MKARSFLLTPLREGRRCPPARPSHTARNFYSRPCGRGDARPRRRCRTPLVHFYSRPCGRGDTAARKGMMEEYVFLLTPLREGRPLQSSTSPQTERFLLTPLREGRLVRRLLVRNPDDHFYSRPCGRGDAGQAAARAGTPISTHAPAGGATGFRRHGTAYRKYFYSRPCGRGDLKKEYEGTVYYISTHAPAGGATWRG